MDLLQAVVVALVQMVEVVHIPENRKKNQNGRMCVRIEKKGRERTPIALYAAY